MAKRSKKQPIIKPTFNEMERRPIHPDDVDADMEEGIVSNEWKTPVEEGDMNPDDFDVDIEEAAEQATGKGLRELFLEQDVIASLVKPDREPIDADLPDPE